MRRRKMWVWNGITGVTGRNDVVEGIQWRNRGKRVTIRRQNRNVQKKIYKFGWRIARCRWCWNIDSRSKSVR